MKKVYTKVAHVTDDAPIVFYEGVRKTLEKMQDAGCEVEVQYQTNSYNGVTNFSALILGYKMEEC